MVAVVVVAVGERGWSLFACASSASPAYYFAIIHQPPPPAAAAAAAAAAAVPPPSPTDDDDDDAASTLSVHFFFFFFFFCPYCPFLPHHVTSNEEQNLASSGCCGYPCQFCLSFCVLLMQILHDGGKWGWGGVGWGAVMIQ